jgi:hypothetical protein
VQNFTATNASHMQQARRIRGKKMAIVRLLRAAGTNVKKYFTMSRLLNGMREPFRAIPIDPMSNQKEVRHDEENSDRSLHGGAGCRR